MIPTYDVIVIGGGHAGCEAILASARIGCRSILITLDPGKIGEMSCNPSIGGLGKGQLVREIDALGGEMGRAADATSLQIKMLNSSKGPAVRSLRSQNDRAAYRQYMQNCIGSEPNIDIHAGEVISLIVRDSEVEGVICAGGSRIYSRNIVIATGTFLNGTLYVGLLSAPGGRIGERAASSLSESFAQLGFEVGRLKTGTPPRVDGRTIDYQDLEILKGDLVPGLFSLDAPSDNLPLLPCFLTYTNSRTHEIIRSSLNQSPLFTGAIRGRGPRYCPSIEDKIIRFSDKDCHQIILEPEGVGSNDIYVNGFSTSLPDSIQGTALRTIKGLEAADITRYGYAVEYDYLPPHQISRSLETRSIRGLFFAGQINGTTGYEEAAAQGLIAGINAALRSKSRDPLILGRDEAYIGVMIDDLITKGADEPYRMFTSRAEYRLMLRHDNAHHRLTDIAYNIGMVSQERVDFIHETTRQIDSEIIRLKATFVKPNDANPILIALKSSPLTEPSSLGQLLSRPEIHYLDIQKLDPDCPPLPTDIINTVETTIKYAGYIEKQQVEIDRVKKWEDRPIPADFDVLSLHALSTEAREKITRHKPSTLGQAARLAGVNPTDISILTVFLERHLRSNKV